MSGKAAPPNPHVKLLRAGPNQARPGQGGRPSGSGGKMARLLVAQMNVKHLRDAGNDRQQFFREK